MKKEIADYTNYLFTCDYFSDDFDPEGCWNHLACAVKLLKEYSWEEIFLVWNEYLHKCKTPDEVLNFCYLFFYYGGHDHKINEPYDFLGYIYSVIDEDIYYGEHFDLLDSLSASVLEKAGEISLYEDPNYKLFDDPKLIQAIKRYC